MPHTKQAACDTFTEPPTHAMTPGLPAGPGIAVEKGSRPVRLVAS